MGSCEHSKAYRIYTPAQRKVAVSLDKIIDETRGYEGEISNLNAIDSPLDSQSDPFIDETTETTHTNSRKMDNNGDENNTERDDQVNKPIVDEFPIADDQTYYNLPDEANTPLEIEEHTPTTERNENNVTGGEQMEVDVPAQQIEVTTNQPQHIQTDLEIGIRQSVRMRNPKYIKNLRNRKLQSKTNMTPSWTIRNGRLFHFWKTERPSRENGSLISNQPTKEQQRFVDLLLAATHSFME